MPPRPRDDLVFLHSVEAPPPPGSQLCAGGPGAQVRSRISAAARWPDRMAPSIDPWDRVEVSVPAQCTRPKGVRSSGPYRVRSPGGKWAIEQPRVHGSVHHAVSMNSTGDVA